MMEVTPFKSCCCSSFRTALLVAPPADPACILFTLHMPERLICLELSTIIYGLFSMTPASTCDVTEHKMQSVDLSFACQASLKACCHCPHNLPTRPPPPAAPLPSHLAQSHVLTGTAIVDGHWCIFRSPSVPTEPEQYSPEVYILQYTSEFL